MILRIALSFVISLSALVVSSQASATPTRRGFQVPLRELTASTLDELVTNWKVNVIRVQVGDNATMDGLTGAAYLAMMDDQFNRLDAALPLLQARNLKAVFILYAPPGGFQTRAGPSHYAMFSDPALQTDFINMWKTIINRYKGNANIAGFDIVNEPAMNKNIPSNGAMNWNDLLLATIQAIRAIDSDSTLYVKPLYGDPNKLSNLPPIADPKVVYVYNSYFFNSYQHTGVVSLPFSIKAPRSRDVHSKMRDALSKFYYTMYYRVDSQKLPASAYPPKVEVGEVAISACARDSAQFVNTLLTSFEKPANTHDKSYRDRELRRYLQQRRRRRSARKPEFEARDFRSDVEHQGYVVHAFGDAPIWDPRYQCDASGNLTVAPSDTDRAIVYKGFFSRN
jgi:hypothetical protein